MPDVLDAKTLDLSLSEGIQVIPPYELLFKALRQGIKIWIWEVDYGVALLMDVFRYSIGFLTD